MLRNVIILTITVISFTSIVSYGIYSVKTDNKIGGVSLFLLAVLVTVGLLLFLVR